MIFKSFTPFQQHAYEAARKRLKLHPSVVFGKLFFTTCATAIPVFAYNHLDSVLWMNIVEGLAWAVILLSILGIVSHGILLLLPSAVAQQVPAQARAMVAVVGKKLDDVLLTRFSLAAAKKTLIYCLTELYTLVVAAATVAALWASGRILTGTVFMLVFAISSVVKELVAGRVRMRLEDLGNADLTGQNASSNPNTTDCPKGEGIVELHVGLFQATAQVVAANLDTRQLIGVEAGEEVKITAPTGNTIIRTVVKVPRQQMNMVHGRIFMTPADYQELGVTPDPTNLTVYVEPNNPPPKKDKVNA